MSSNVMMPAAIDDGAPRPLRELYFELGRSLLARGNFAEAILSFQHALDEEGSEPDAGKILFYLACSLEQDEKKREAFHTYLEAILRNPARCSIILAHAHTLLRRSIAAAEKQWLLEEWTKKITDAKLNEEDRAQVAFFLGRCSLYLEAYSDALSYFEQAMHSLAGDARVVEGYGEALWKAGNVAKAEHVLQNARTMIVQNGDMPRLVEIDVKLAQVFAGCGHYDKALPLIARLLTNNARYAFELLLSRAQCYLDLGDAKRGLEAIDAAIEQDGASVQAHLLRAQLLISLGRYQDAITSTNQALQNDPSNRQVMFYKSQALIEGQIDLEQGRSLLKRFAERKGQSAIQSMIESPAFLARVADGNVHYFLAECYSLFNNAQKALEEIRLALEYRLHGTISYPEAPVYRLKAELLEREDKTLEAASAYQDAGNHFGWRNDFQTAVTLLEKARDLNGNSAQIYWDVANAYYMSCLLEDYPFVKPEPLEQSRVAWENGIRLGLPEAENSWIYLLKGFINDRMLLLSNNASERLGLLWESAAYVERALLLYEPEVFRWTYMGRYHRMLNNESNALDATQKALTYEKDNVGALDERGAILANVGRFEEAMEVLEKRLGIEASTWTEAVKAYVLMHMVGKLDDALVTIEKVVQSPISDVWFRALRALCYRMLDRLPDALEDYKALWERYKESDYNNLFDFAWAAFYLGKLDKAIDMMQQALSDPLQEKSPVHVSLARFYLEKRDFASAEKHLTLFVERLVNPRQLDDFFKFDYPEMQKAYAQTPDGPRIMALLDATRERLEARREQIARGKTPLEELTQRLEDYTRGGGIDARVIVGMHAGIARLKLEQKDGSGAAAEYQLLKDYTALFPEAFRGLAATFEMMQNEGDALLKPRVSGQTPDPAGALAHYNELLNLGLFAENRVQQSDLRARLGLASLAMGDAAAARQHFLSAFRLAREGALSEPGAHPGLLCSALLLDVDQYWALEDEWRAFADSSETDELLRLDINAARYALQQYLHQEYQLSSETVSTPVIERIILEVGEGLVPENASNDMPLVKEYIPALRQHMYERWGVILPFVRVRDNPQLEKNEYLILLDEIPLARASVPLSMAFCPSPLDQLQQLGIPLDDLKEAAHPLDGSPGCWVAQASWSRVDEHTIELWKDPFFFLSAHMSAFLLWRPDEFVSLQDIDALIEYWKQSDLGEALIRAALPDDNARRFLSQLLRALLKEQVPITAWEDILAVLSEAMLDKSDFQTTLYKLRLRLQQFLPGNASNKQLVEIPPDLEEKIGQSVSYQQPTWTLKADPQRIWELLSAIYTLVESRDCVLVVSRPDMRWFVRQLISMAFPALMVLSREEVVPRTA